MKRMVIFLVCSALLLAAGCATMYMHQHMQGNDKENVFAFGYIDVDMALSSLGWVSFIQLLPKAPDGSMKEYAFWTGDGAFFNGNLPPGSYLFEKFGMGHSVINFGAHAFKFRMNKPGIYFLGSYKVKRDADIFSHSIGLEKKDSPAESEVLEKYIIPGAAGTKWELPLKNRLEELKGKK